ncbi:ribosomal-processing cysteine protease Prp [Clostridium sp. AF37-5]|nr:ribosomal-processing cysteine protease Prp [Clostridium sp. AF37-5]
MEQRNRQTVWQVYRRVDMLSIRIDWAKETFELDVVGHAGYAEHGKDIVCAAVSVIVGMFASEIENHEKLYPGQQVEVKNGLAMIHTTYRSKLRANIVFGMLVDALLDLEEQYPEYIKILISKTMGVWG